MSTRCAWPPSLCHLSVAFGAPQPNGGAKGTTLSAPSHELDDTRWALCMSDPGFVISRGQPRKPQKPLRKRTFLIHGHRARIPKHVKVLPVSIWHEHALSGTNGGPTRYRVGLMECRQPAHGCVEQTLVTSVRHYIGCRMPTKYGTISLLRDGKIFSFFFIFSLPSGVEAPSLNEIQDSATAKADCSSPPCTSQTRRLSSVTNGEFLRGTERCRTFSRTCP